MQPFQLGGKQHCSSVMPRTMQNAACSENEVVVSASCGVPQLNATVLLGLTVLLTTYVFPRPDQINVVNGNTVHRAVFGLRPRFSAFRGTRSYINCV
jgi:hypothetical protein